MKHFIVGPAEFHYQHKFFKLSNHIIQQVLGIPSGPIPLHIRSVPEDVKSNVEKGIPIYKVKGHSKSNIVNVVALCLADHREDSFMHSFMLIAITSILCPSTPNTLGFDYLYFLNSPASIQEYDWVSHILNQIQSSIRKYQAYIHTFKDDSQSGSHYFLGCLPLLAISSFSMLSVLLVYLFFKYFHLSFISHIVLFFGKFVYTDFLDINFSIHP
ncbi:hypothetical protein GQ55_5G362400 [Panicum hallii var. hallii]|uniref:Uncharacterized protein n=1 Tax=Panicum hallii var. hallii TaxID=1504633 RepID=A0A2T7DMF0_9POAL|nr:hypothetical protein GQ55_5G362400 [Panicum hallii var. hallii]